MIDLGEKKKRWLMSAWFQRLGYTSAKSELLFINKHISRNHYPIYRIAICIMRSQSHNKCENIETIISWKSVKVSNYIKLGVRWNHKKGFLRLKILTLNFPLHASWHFNEKNVFFSIFLSLDFSCILKKWTLFFAFVKLV